MKSKRASAAKRRPKSRAKIFPLKLGTSHSRDGRKVVVIGGGTGVFTLLTGLRDHFDFLTAIVTMADDGGSTGVLREDFGILPPGDVRRALVALSESDNKMLSELFNYRFDEGKGLKGHSFGNLILTALERMTGSFDKAIAEAGRLLAVRGRVVPVTLKAPRLAVELENGKVIRGETNIDIPKHNGNLKIIRAWLEPEVSANKEALRAIREADLVVVGPGDLYTSIIPNILVQGIPRALTKTKAKVAYVVNLMTKHGETNDFRASDFVKVIEGYAGEKSLDYVLVNKNQPSPARTKAYIKQDSEYVLNDLDSHSESSAWELVVADVIRSRGFVRHDSKKIAKVLKELIQ